MLPPPCFAVGLVTWCLKLMLNDSVFGFIRPENLKFLPSRVLQAVFRCFTDERLFSPLCHKAQNSGGPQLWLSIWNAVSSLQGPPKLIQSQQVLLGPSPLIAQWDRAVGSQKEFLLCQTSLVWKSWRPLPPGNLLCNKTLFFFAAFLMILSQSSAGCSFHFRVCICFLQCGRGLIEASAFSTLVQSVYVPAGGL